MKQKWKLVSTEIKHKPLISGWTEFHITPGRETGCYAQLITAQGQEPPAEYRATWAFQAFYEEDKSQRPRAEAPVFDSLQNEK